MKQQAEINAKRHIQSFVHMVREGKSYTAAWEVIKARTTLGESARAELSDRCIAAEIASR
jgi:hypothetical protein